MADPTHREPGPDHPITVEPAPVRVVVRAVGQVLADSTEALALHEADYPVTYYVPRADVDLAALERTDHGTHCPYKGDAAYFSVPGLGERGVNAVWSYESPYPAVAPIRDHLAFYPDRMDAIEELPR